MKFKLRSWKLLLPLAALVAVISITTSISSAAPAANEVRVGIMTDCKGAFGFGYEPDIGGAQAAFAKYAGGKAKNKKKPSAGMTGIKIGGKSVKIVGYGCGNDTADLAIKETKRLMEQLKADIMVDDYSFGWTSAAGMIADFCAVGGQITKRVFPPLNTTDYAPYVRQLPSPNQVDGYFWVVGGTGTGASLKAYEQAYGKLQAKKFIGNLFFAFLGNFKEVAPRLVGAYVGGFGTAPGLKTAQAKAYEASVAKTYPGLNAGNYADGFVYNYYNAAWTLVRGLQKAGGDLNKVQASMPRTNKSGYEVSDKGTVVLDSNRQAVQDQWPLQIQKGPKGLTTAVVGYVPNVGQSFGGLFKKSSPAPGRSQPACKKQKLPWQGKIKVVKNGKVTATTLK